MKLFLTFLGYFLAAFVLSLLLLLQLTPGFPTITTGARIATVLMIVCIFGCLFILICEGRFYKTTVDTWNVSLWSAIFIMAVVGVSLQMENSHWSSWLLYTIAMLFPLVLFLISVYAYLANRQAPQPAQQRKKGLRRYFNPKKGLAGAGFGDFAGSVGILAGVGAFQMDNISPGWFWLGLFGVFLSILIGLNLCLRWMREKSDKQWVPACLPYCAGVLTFLALFTGDWEIPTSGADLQTTTSVNANITGLFDGQLAFLIVVSFLGIVMFALSYRKDRNIEGAIILTAIFTVIAFVILLIPKDPKYPEWLINTFGILATLTGIILELISFSGVSHPFFAKDDKDAWQVTTDTQTGAKTYYIKNWKAPLRIMRGVDIILGNLAILILVVWVWRWPHPLNNDPGTYSPEQWFVFCGAIVLMVQASLGGIILSAHDVAERRAREEEERLVFKDQIQKKAKEMTTRTAANPFYIRGG